MRIDTYNLSALSDRLIAEGRHKALAGKIREAVRYHSLRSDLIMAEETCDALAHSLATPRADRHQTITESALLCNAIVLYSRATHSSSDERAPSDLLSRLTTDERKVHDEIIDLRNQAVAHYGSGGSYEGEWKNELAVLFFRHPDESKPSVVTQRLTVDRRLADRLRKQVAVARSMIEQTFHKKIRLVSAEIDALSAADDEFYREIAAHPLNLNVFMKSTDVADQVRASFDQGYASGVVEH